MAAILAAIAGAGVIGGGMMSGQAATSAGHQAQDSYDWGTGHGMQRLLNSLYGSGSVWQGDLSSMEKNPDGSYKVGKRPTYGSDGILGRMQGVADKFRQGSGDIMSGYGADTQSLLGNYRAQTNQLDTLGAGAEGMAKQWGAGREATIRDDSARSLKSANRMGDAALAAGGFNSPTYRANQYNANAQGNQREMQRSLQDLSSQQIARQMGARNQRTNLMADRFGNETSLQANRMQGNTQLQTGFLGTQAGLDAAPLQTEMQAMQSSIMNPYLGQNTSAYYPGGSALGSALQSAGQTAGGLAAYQYGQYQQGNQNESLLAQLQAMMAQGGGR